MILRNAAVRALQRSAFASSSPSPSSFASSRASAAIGGRNANANANAHAALLLRALSSSSSHSATASGLPPPGSRTSFDLPDPARLMSYNESTHVTHPDAEPVPSEPAGNNRWHPQLTKIVATIGPTSEQFEPLQEVVRSGMRVMRLNFSHATKEEVELRTGNLARCQGRHGKALARGVSGEYQEQNVRAILLDTRGPEVRTGKLRHDESGHETVRLTAGDTITLHTSDKWSEAGSTEKDLFVNYAGLHKCLEPGMKVLLDDGAVILTVQSAESDKDYGSVTCTIDNTGDLRSRAGVNLPGAETDLPAMSEKDRADIKYGMTKDIDFVAASFIQNAEGVREIRRYIKDCAKELGWAPSAPLPLIISKIESVSGLRNFDAILDESDGVMVARGDLGVEIPIQQVVNAQKEMVAACNAVGKPVIVATQMLESMGKNPRPTRAEVADVTNAVYDGADAVMLSGETAKGRYPVEAVRMMNEIIYSAERFTAGRSDLVGPLGGGSRMFEGISREMAMSPDAAVAKAAVTAAEERHAAAILVLTDHGTLPRFVSGYRPSVPIVAFCPSAKVARQLQLHRGVHPVIGTPGLSPGKKCARAIQQAENMGLVSPGEDVICVMMEDDEDIGSFATMKVAKVPSSEK